MTKPPDTPIPEREVLGRYPMREMTPERGVELGVDTPYCDYASVESVQTALERAKEKQWKDNGIPLPISAYSFRHKLATVLRRARIPEDEIAAQLGHKPPAPRNYIDVRGEIAGLSRRRGQGD